MKIYIPDSDGAHAYQYGSNPDQLADLKSGAYTLKGPTSWNPTSRPHDLMNVVLRRKASKPITVAEKYVYASLDLPYPHEIQGFREIRLIEGCESLFELGNTVRRYDLRPLGIYEVIVLSYVAFDEAPTLVSALSSQSSWKPTSGATCNLLLHAEPNKTMEQRLVQHHLTDHAKFLNQMLNDQGGGLDLKLLPTSYDGPPPAAGVPHLGIGEREMMHLIERKMKIRCKSCDPATCYCLFDLS